MNDNTTISVILYSSKVLKNGENPLMLRITQNRKRKYKSLGISCKINDWDIKNNRPKSKHPNKALLEKIISKKIAEYKEQVLEFKSEGKDYTVDTLLNTVEKPTRRISVFNFYTEIIDRLKSTNQLGNAGAYKDSKNSIMNFTKEKDIMFSEIDYSFLIKYETEMRKKELNENSISFYFRTLRALFNKAIQEKVCKATSYPFKKFKVAKFSNETKRRAITKDEIKKIEALDIPESSKRFTARQYFLFSFYCQGINFADIALLKWENIIGNRVFYTRAKTGKEINFILLEPALKIIEYWKPITSKSKKHYVFPILNNEIHISPTQIKNRTHKVIGIVNEALKEIGQDPDVGLEIPLTTYVARHTFATVLKRSGVSTAIISETMGHKTETITQVYLKSFENEIIDEAVKNLL